MYTSAPLTGAGMTPKTLCFTFDDGPGPETIPIASFLHSEGIRACFFVVGKYAQEHPETLAMLKEQGHLVANHTFDHPDIPYYISVNGNLTDQVSRTDSLIRPYLEGQPVFFRAPYGKWSAEAAELLNRHFPATIGHIGPIHWDIAGIDCHYWRNKWSVQEAVAAYLKDITEKGSGIVVMHDQIADMDFLQPANQTLDLTKALVPILKAAGYEFIPLDEVPSVREAIGASREITIRTPSGGYLSVDAGLQAGIVASKNPNNREAHFSLADLGYGKVALKTVHGVFLELNADLVTATGITISPGCAFDLVPLDGGSVVFRAFNGNYLAWDNGKAILSAKAPFMRGASVFFLSLAHLPVVPIPSFTQRLRLLKKRARYIWSRVTSNA